MIIYDKLTSDGYCYKVQSSPILNIFEYLKVIILSPRLFNVADKTVYDAVGFRLVLFVLVDFLNKRSIFLQKKNCYTPDNIFICMTNQTKVISKLSLLNYGRLKVLICPKNEHYPHFN